jgi:hypothetical protein
MARDVNPPRGTFLFFSHFAGTLDSLGTASQAKAAGHCLGEGRQASPGIQPHIAVRPSARPEVRDLQGSAPTLKIRVRKKERMPLRKAPWPTRHGREDDTPRNPAWLFAPALWRP